MLAAGYLDVVDELQVAQVTYLDVVDELQVAEVADADEGFLGGVEVEALERVVGERLPVAVRHAQARDPVRVPAAAQSVCARERAPTQQATVCALIQYRQADAIAHLYHTLEMLTCTRT